MTKEELRRLRELYKKGLTYPEIAEEMNYTKVTIRRNVRRLRLPYRVHGKARWESTLSRYDLADLKAQWENGIPRAKICEWWGISTTCLANVVRRLGLEPRPGPGGALRKYTREQAEQMLEARESGVPIEEICKRFGCSSSTLYRYIADVTGKVGRA